MQYDSDYMIRLETLAKLGGDTSKQYNSVYDIDIAILDAIQSGGGDMSNYYTKAQVNALIAELELEIKTIEGNANSDIVASTNYDFTFVQQLPESGEDEQLVVIRGANNDTLYEFTESQWQQKLFESNIFYFDTENEVLYNYKSDESKLAEVGLINTYVISGDYKTNALLKTIKSVGTYNILQHTTSGGKPVMKNWVLTVYLSDYETQDRDVIWQEMRYNYTIARRSYKQSTNVWGSFTEYYDGLINDVSTTNLSTHCWSADKTQTEINNVKLSSGKNISITSKRINAKGYNYNVGKFSFAEAEEVLTNVAIWELKLTGAANATTYDFTYVNGIPGVPFEAFFYPGVVVQIADGSRAKIISLTTNPNTMTFNKTLNASSALNAEQVTSTVTYNEASGFLSHAEGSGCIASGDGGSHAEGSHTEARQGGAHAEGYQTIADGLYSHTEGGNTYTSGTYSHTEGEKTTAQNLAEHSEGRFNNSHKSSDSYGNAGNTQHSIGIGTSANAHKNALEVMQNGDVYIYGIGGYQGTNTHVQDEDVDSLQMYISALETYLQGLETRIYNLEHPTTIE